jgi:hypothetical protein
VYVKEVYGSALNLGLLMRQTAAGRSSRLDLRRHRTPPSSHATFVGAFMLTTVRFWVYLFQPPIAVLVASTLYRASARVR